MTLNNAKTPGVYAKYTVTRNDGKSAPGQKHHDCEFYVIDVTHDPYALPALEAYADACQKDMPELAADIRRRWLIQQDHP